MVAHPFEVLVDDFMVFGEQVSLRKKAVVAIINNSPAEEHPINNACRYTVRLINLPYVKLNGRDRYDGVGEQISDSPCTKGGRRTIAARTLQIGV